VEDALRIIFIAVVFLLSVVPLYAEEKACSRDVKQGLEQLRAGKYQAAIKRFEAAVKVDPACAEAYEGMGDAYLGMGDNGISSNPELIEKGVSNYRHAVSINPNLPTAHHKLAVGYLALNNKEMAVKELELLRGMDKGLADDLSAKIDAFKTPGKYRLTGSKGEKSANTTKRGTGASQPAAEIRKERFSGTVEVFATSWCPSCKKTIAYLQEKGIPYVAYDVEADAQAKRRFDELGGRAYPLVLIGTNRFYGFNPDKINYYVGR
jgi:glutaredoxin